MKKNILGFCGFLAITVLLFVYISQVFLPTLDIIGGYENESVSPTAAQSAKAMKIILPAFYVYLGAIFSFFYFKIRGLNKIVFPMCVFTLYYLFMNIGLASMGVAFIWIGVFTFIPAIGILLISIFLGWKIDKKQKTTL